MKNIIAFGTFDIFHQGHKYFLRKAKTLGDKLIVVVARDKNVETVKGALPHNSETTRVKNVRKAQIADKVILGSKTNNYFQTLRTYKISVIALGYDQRPSINNLKKTLKRHRLGNLEIVRLRAYNPHKYKSSLLKTK